MLCRRDEIPPLPGDTHAEAQQRKHLEQQLWIRLHPGILHAALLPIVIISFCLGFRPAERLAAQPRSARERGFAFARRLARPVGCSGLASSPRVVRTLDSATLMSARNA
jgi:hypothetical protein